MMVAVAHDGGCAVLRLAGRFDSDAADHLAGTIDALVHDGQRSVLLDLAEVTYISSPAIQLLERLYRQLSALRGELRVQAPSPLVLQALVAADLRTKLLVEAQDTATLTRLRTSAVMRGLDLTRDSWRRPSTQTIHGTFEVTPRDADASLICRLIGPPGRLMETGADPRDCRVVDFPETAFGLGIGAIGRTFADAAPRFGELVGAAGAVAYLPTDGARVADFDVGLGGRAPVVLLASGIVCEGGFSQLVRFSAESEADASPLAELARVCLDAAGADTVGMVMLAETAGLVGAWLRRSPGTSIPGTGGDVGTVREWLGTTPAPTHQGTTVLAVGIVSRKPDPVLGGQLRPLADAADLAGHFHAVVFAYRPVPQRTVALRNHVSELFAQHRIRGVMHLLSDDRRGMGAGESAFRRGLCWVAPVVHVAGTG
jgi:anti-anti-sigma factor